MIRKNIIKALALGLCISSLWAGAAYAQSGGGVSAAYGGAEETQDATLFEKQREIDEYLFVEHSDLTEKMGFSVIYTGVADTYVEIGITPYSDGNAKMLYDLFGSDLVKVVETEMAVTYQAKEEPDFAEKDVQDKDVRITDTGKDTPVSADASDGVLMRGEETGGNAEDEELRIQIESIQETEPDNLTETGESSGMKETVGNIDGSESTDIKTTAAQDDLVTITSTDNNGKRDFTIPGIVSAVAGCIIVIGGAAVAVKKKKTGKDN